MKKSYAIQIKAAFLLFIFSLNMFVGFACSIGIDTDVMSPYHVKPEGNTPHSHAHQHKSNAGKDHHGTPKSHDHNTCHKGKEDKKGCCNDEVQKVQQLDKNINSSAKSIAFQNTAVLTPTFFQPYTVKLLKANPTKSRDRFFYPPSPNILVEFQRFQI
jgi:hypothetical protein